MAFDPSAPGDVFGMLALNATTVVTLSLDVRYVYELRHTGKDAGGTDDANSALSAWLSKSSGVLTADDSVEDDKYELVDAETLSIGPGISALYLVSTAGADGVVKLARVGTPTNSY